MRVIVISCILFFGLVFSIVYFYPELVESPSSIHEIETHSIGDPFMSGDSEKESVTLASVPIETEKKELSEGTSPHTILDVENQGVNTRNELSQQKARQLNNAEILSSKYGAKQQPLSQTDKGKLAVIVHQSNIQNLSQNELKDIYLQQTTHWSNGAEIKMYNLPLGDEWRDQFTKRLMKMSALELYEQQRSGPIGSHSTNARKVKSKNLVVSYVERDPEAIAYVPLALVRKGAGVRVIMTLPE